MLILPSAPAKRSPFAAEPAGSFPHDIHRLELSFDFIAVVNRRSFQQSCDFSI
jgi:hypothetical protein